MRGVEKMWGEPKSLRLSSNYGRIHLSQIIIPSHPALSLDRRYQRAAWVLPRETALDEGAGEQ